MEDATRRVCCSLVAAAVSLATGHRPSSEPGAGPAQRLEVLGNGNPRYFADHMQPGRSVFPRQEDVDSEVGESALSCDRDWP